MQDSLGSVRGEVNDAMAVNAVRHYEPYGVPFDTAGTFSSDFGFTGEPVDANELVYLRARYLNAELGVFPSLDPVENNNRYAYVDSNPINRTDTSGNCWQNNSATPQQRSQCSDTWSGYMDIINNTYTLNWPRDVREAITQEARHWAYLSYDEFANQWNSSTPNQGNTYQQAAVVAVGAAAVTGPTPDDILWLSGALCLSIFAMAASSGAIALPRRQPWYFPVHQTQGQSRAQDDSVPIPFPLNRDIPNDYRRVFDVALGRGGTLSNFASFFVDRPTVPFGSWPDWMIYDPPGKPGDSPTGNWLPLMSREDEVVAAAVETALMAWAVEVPTGIIKFNLEGLDRTDPAPHRITLSELRRVSTNPLLAPKTRYFFYYPTGGGVGIGGIARELNPFEVASELMRLASLM